MPRMADRFAAVAADSDARGLRASPGSSRRVFTPRTTRWTPHQRHGNARDHDARARVENGGRATSVAEEDVPAQSGARYRRRKNTPRTPRDAGGWRASTRRRAAIRRRSRRRRWRARRRRVDPSGQAAMRGARPYRYRDMRRPVRHRDAPVVVVSGGTGSGAVQYILEDAIRGGGRGDRVVVTTASHAAVSVAERRRRARRKVRKRRGFSVRLHGTAPRDDGAGVEFVTTGVLLRRLMRDPSLEGTSHVMIDEVHERDINTDFLLVLLRALLRRRPELRVVLMSATLDAESFSDYFSKKGGFDPIAKRGRGRRRARAVAPPAPLLSVPASRGTPWRCSTSRTSPARRTTRTRPRTRTRTRTRRGLRPKTSNSSDSSSSSSSSGCLFSAEGWAGRRRALLGAGPDARARTGGGAREERASDALGRVADEDGECDLLGGTRGRPDARTPRTRGRRTRRTTLSGKRWRLRWRAAARRVGPGPERSIGAPRSNAVARWKCVARTRNVRRDPRGTRGISGRGWLFVALARERSRGGGGAGDKREREGLVVALAGEVARDRRT